MHMAVHQHGLNAIVAPSRSRVEQAMGKAIVPLQEYIATFEVFGELVKMVCSHVQAI